MDIELSTDKSKLDIVLIHQFLTDAYWAKGRTLEQVELSINNSMCFGVYADRKQIGFARVISDHFTFGYIADLFIVESFRGRGFSKQLLNYIFSSPDLSLVNYWSLFTKDAQGLYAQFDFEEFNDSNTSFMVKKIAS